MILAQCMYFFYCSEISLKRIFFSWNFHCRLNKRVILLKIWKVMKWNQIPFNMIMPINFFFKRRYFWVHFRCRRVLKIYQPFRCKIKSFARKNRTESPSFAAFYHIIFIIWYFWGYIHPIKRRVEKQWGILSLKPCLCNLTQKSPRFFKGENNPMQIKC